MTAVDQQPGFRRRFRLTPAPQAVQAEVEDDFHCMSVIVRHDGERAIEIEPDLRRAPWSTCPGAVEKLRQTFSGVALASFAERGEKQSNCTHLHDLATLAAAHAFDNEATIYDILVSDPVNGQRHAEVRCNGRPVLNWTEAQFQIVEPKTAAGVRLDKLKTWIVGLAPDLQEPAKLLQWGNILANGRTIPLEKQSDATKMPASCYTFQPERAVVAQRIGLIRDFSECAARPLDDYEPKI